MNMKTDEMNSLNNSDNEHIDNTVNDATSKTEEEDSNHTTSISEETAENHGNSDQATQTNIGDEDSSSSSDKVEQSESLEAVSYTHLTLPTILRV